MSMARWNTIRRCSPMVVPLLPPIGVAGVASLNPSLGPSRLISRMVAARASDGFVSTIVAQMTATAAALPTPHPRHSLIRRCSALDAFVHGASRTYLAPDHGPKTAVQFEAHTAAGAGWQLLGQVLLRARRCLFGAPGRAVDHCAWWWRPNPTGFGVAIEPHAWRGRLRPRIGGVRGLGCSQNADRQQRHRRAHKGASYRERRV